MAKKILKIKGEWDRKDVLVDGFFLCPKQSIDYNRVADRFGWGQPAPETFQLGLALAIYIYDRFPEYETVNTIAMKIADDVLCKLPQDDFEIDFDVTKYTTPPKPTIKNKDDGFGELRWVASDFMHIDYSTGTTAADVTNGPWWRRAAT